MGDGTGWEWRKNASSKKADFGITVKVWQKNGTFIAVPEFCT
jgi:hypothetical protein